MLDRLLKTQLNLKNRNPDQSMNKDAKILRCRRGNIDEAINVRGGLELEHLLGSMPASSHPLPKVGTRHSESRREREEIGVNDDSRA